MGKGANNAQHRLGICSMESNSSFMECFLSGKVVRYGLWVDRRGLACAARLVMVLRAGY